MFWRYLIRLLTVNQPLPAPPPLSIGGKKPGGIGGKGNKKRVKMTKEQYKAVVRAQREAAKPAKKLIHLLINFRSHNWERYPKQFTEVLKCIKKGEEIFDSGGLWYFYQLEGDNWRQPRFPYAIRVGFSYNRDTEPDLPF